MRDREGIRLNYLERVKELKKQWSDLPAGGDVGRVISVESVISPLSTACSCDPLPSQAEYGHLAQAGCGPSYERCSACGYRWRCKICSGCRRCRFPG